MESRHLNHDYTQNSINRATKTNAIDGIAPEFGAIQPNRASITKKHVVGIYCNVTVYTDPEGMGGSEIQVINNLSQVVGSSETPDLM